VVVCDFSSCCGVRGNLGGRFLKLAIMRKSNSDTCLVDLCKLLAAVLTSTSVWAVGCAKDQPNDDDDSGFGSTMSSMTVGADATTDPDMETGGTSASTTSASTSTSTSTTNASTTNASTTSASMTGPSTDATSADVSSSSSGEGEDPGGPGDPTTAYNSCDDCMDPPNSCAATLVGSMCVMSCTMPETQAECPNPKNGTSVPMCLPAQGYGDICVLMCEMMGEPSNCPTGMECTRVGTADICLWPPASSNGTETGGDSDTGGST